MAVVLVAGRLFYVDFVLLSTQQAIYFAFPFLSGTFQELSGTFQELSLQVVEIPTCPLGSPVSEN
jgi:hypothetical protein